MSIKPERLHLLKPTRFIVNWGSSENERFDYRCKILNKPESVALAANKVHTFNAWTEHGVSCPEYTVFANEALAWLEDEHTVFCRTTITGHSGRGIVIAERPEQLVRAHLYTKYIKKKKEFRVHVFKDKVIDIQEKRKSHAVSEVDFRIRNHASGFVFCRDDITEPHDLRSTSIAAVKALGLDFGAVDIIYNEKQDKCYALEVNTAPGLEGTTLDSYINNIVEVAYG